MIAPADQRPKAIEWERTKWQEDHREWETVVRIPTMLALRITTFINGVNDDEYAGAKPGRLRVAAMSWTGTGNGWGEATLRLTETRHNQAIVPAYDPEGGLFGTPVVHEIQVYDLLSFPVLFGLIEAVKS